MRRGERHGAAPPLAAARDRCRDQLARLPRRLQSIDPSGGVHRFDYPVYLSAKVRALADEVDQRVAVRLAASH
jgi:hypothetical protein